MSSAAPTVLDAWAYPDDTAAGLAHWVPQASLISVLDELRPSMLSPDGRIDAFAVERHIAMLQARSSELLSALDAGDTTEDQFTRDAVAAALRLPPASMKTRMASARDLAERLPGTLELLRAGVISQRHAADLVDLTRSLPLESASAVETSVLSRAPRQTTAQFRAAVRRAVLRVTTPAVEEAADAVTERRVVFTPAPNGMTELWAFLSADSAALIKTTLDAVAHHTIHLPGGDDRTADQRRADALVDLARTALTHPTPAGPAQTGRHPADSEPSWPDPTPTEATGPLPAGPRLARGHGQRPAIHVTIAASTPHGPRRPTR